MRYVVLIFLVAATAASSAPRGPTHLLELPVHLAQSTTKAQIKSLRKDINETQKKRAEFLQGEFNINPKDDDLVTMEALYVETLAALYALDDQNDKETQKQRDRLNKLLATQRKKLRNIFEDLAKKGAETAPRSEVAVVSLARFEDYEFLLVRLAALFKALRDLQAK
ncbi:hypothetical protein AIOL_004780 [Candidatus Rhodobacter oscarellae]|uniref:Uncharacterized protein n=1 Tax=Candidatus Rhodobacter oscarellae TaxID=1675527 RepID=A0A0J9EAZ2_9RHOB|nr:hypothetical protein [Candidatus Rhodobacter lobularis]KMW59796.1 hypothetical protein AIOL_004780 [Candidatus Rhodobacter lobularis]